MTDEEDKTVRQFVLFCRTALMYEKNYYNELILSMKEIFPFIAPFSVKLCPISFARFLL